MLKRDYMKNRYLKTPLFLIVILAFSIGYGQKSPSPWTKTTKNNIAQRTLLPQKTVPQNASYYQLDMGVLKSNLQNAPQRDSGRQSKTLLDFPNADGSMETFTIMEYSVMHPELQAKFPDIRSYVGYGLKNAATVVYFSVSPSGLHSMTMSIENGVQFINPYTSDGVYEAFSRSAIPVTANLFECGVMEDGLSRSVDLDLDVAAARNANDGKRRTFRLAVGTSIEYTNFHGGTVASALDAINATMTRVNAIYESELSIRMTLVANNNLLISTTGNSLFSNEGNINATTGIINSIIGEGAYDMGHTFTTASGGSAYLARVCTNTKGAATTGLPQPIGDPFNVDFVAHEMGHQFGATHTFNGTTGFCTPGNRTGITAYEPGSGSTIMAYAGTCSPQNVQPNSGDYFHQASLQQIWKNITEGSSTCASITVTGNIGPSVDAGESYTIPISTPYKLSGSSADPDGTGTHTYTWEQFDLGPAGVPTVTTEFGPMVRSFQDTPNPVRYIPRLQDALANGGTSTTYEKLASIERVLNFALTVRDNDSRGGQTAVDYMSVTTIDSPGPFRVTSQTSEVTWEIGSNKTVTWDVADTNIGLVNTLFVNIKLSIDGGVTFPYFLATNVPNDGSHVISVPAGTVTNKARIMVEGAGNIFYNLNIANFKIIDVDYLLNFSPMTVTVCRSNNAVYNFTYNTYRGYNQNTVFSAINLPTGASATFSPTSASADGTPGTMTITGLGSIAPGTYEFSAVGTSGSITNSSVLELNLFSNSIATIALIAPINDAAGLYSNVELSWEDDVNVEDYLLEISTTSNFNNIVDSQMLTTNLYEAALELETVYYWRVTGTNRCSGNTTSSINTFSTGVSTCNMSITATDTPIAISPTGSNTYSSALMVTENLPITDVNVKVNVQHEWAKDLRLVLISPKGVSILLSNNNSLTEGENYTNTIFDQQATESITQGSAPFTGSYIPEGDLSVLNGELSAGTWRLQVTDLFDTDGGSLLEYTLQLCLARPLSLEDNSFEAFAIFPNPNQGEFTIKLKSTSGEAIKIEVYDIRGRKVQENRYENTTNFREVIRLDNIQSGMYLINISDGLRTVTKKILVN
jgi:subtilisin-like proprotein convertase family protein